MGGLGVAYYLWTIKHKKKTVGGKAGNGGAALSKNKARKWRKKKKGHQGCCDRYLTTCCTTKSELTVELSIVRRRERLISVLNGKPVGLFYLL